MRKIQSYDKTMAFFLVTREEMGLLRESLLLELEYETILKRAIFSEMIFGQYCIRSDLKLLNDCLDYMEATNHLFKNKKKRAEDQRLVDQIRDAFFNPEVAKKEAAKNVVAQAVSVIEGDEISRDPAFQELIAKIKPLIEKLDDLGAPTRFVFLKCYNCGADETDNAEGERSLLDYDQLPTGYTEMEVLDDHEEKYKDDQCEGYITVYKFMCPACNMLQTAVCSMEI